MELNEEFKAIIAKNLPQAVGATLQERLQQADIDAGKVKNLTRANSELADEVNVLKARLQERDAMIAQHEAIEVRVRAVEERERNATVTELKTQLAASHENTRFARDVALGLVRNIEYRTSVHESGMTPIERNSGSGYAMVEQHPTTSTTTTDRSAK
jgi:hypothetical protein